MTIVLIVFRLVGLAAGVSLAACSSSPTINSDFDRGRDFSVYQTFSWMPERTLLVAQVTPVSPLLEGQLKRATRSELTAKGLRFVADPEQADMVVSFLLGSRDKIRVDSYPETYSIWSRGAPLNQSGTVRNYTEGTLFIDLFDVQLHAPVWHGWATKTIHASDRGNERLMSDIVARILAQFPAQGSP